MKPLAEVTDEELDEYFEQQLRFYESYIEDRGIHLNKFTVERIPYQRNMQELESGFISKRKMKTND